MLPRIAWLTALLLAAAPAYAGPFNVSPTRITLSARARTTLVSLSNLGDEPMRFQLTPYRWDQHDGDAMVLEPTDAVVVYPSLVTLAPGETRRVRVGTTEAFGPDEGAFRLFVEELPPITDTGAPGIRVLTRTGLPVFLAPDRAAPAGRIGEVRIDGGSVSVDLANEGNVHVMVQKLVVQATTGEPVEARGWYVLPGHTWTMAMPLPAEACASGEVELRAYTDQGIWTDQVAVPEEACVGSR